MNETNDKTKRELPALPEVWPGWETVEKLGSGSFGAVYKVCRQSGSFTEYAAVKCISIPKEADEIDRLRRNGYNDESITANFREQGERLLEEYRLMTVLKGNTNIVNCDDVRSVLCRDGFGMDIFIRMELLTPLDSPEYPTFTENEIVKLGIDLCTALTLCEKQKIIHRDIKPANIFVSKNGDYKLGDFGVSRIMEETTSADTKTGTPRFMAPEVYRGYSYNRTVDIYSLGLVLYWLLNERRTPFQPLPPAALSYRGDAEALDRRMKGEAIPEPKNGSEALKKIVLKAVAYEHSERYQSAAEMKAALEKMNEPVPEPEPVPSPKPIPKWPFAFAAVLLLALVLALAGKGKKQPPERSVATPTATPVAATAHVHSWAEADCDRPATCTLCGETQGVALGHSWTPATCVTARRCTVCGLEEGTALGHSWIEATKEQPRRCVLCGLTDGEPLRSSDVDLYTEDKSGTKRFGTRVAHSPSLEASETVVRNMRKRGYNAYLYEVPGYAGYGIVVGAFDDYGDATSLANAFHLQPKVQGADLEGAYVVNVYLSEAAIRQYAYTAYADTSPTVTSAPTSATQRESVLGQYYTWLWWAMDWQFECDMESSEMRADYYLLDVDGDGIEELLILVRGNRSMTDGCYLLYSSVQTADSVYYQLIAKGSCSAEAYPGFNRNNHVLGIFEYHGGAEYADLLLCSTVYRSNGTLRETCVSSQKAFEFSEEAGISFASLAGSYPWTGNYEFPQAANLSCLQPYAE